MHKKRELLIEAAIYQGRISKLTQLSTRAEKNVKFCQTETDAMHGVRLWQAKITEFYEWVLSTGHLEKTKRGPPPLFHPFL